MSIVDVRNAPNAVWLAMPFDKRWGYDMETRQKNGGEVDGIKILMMPDEASRYTEPEEIINGGWKNFREIILGFCSAGYNWREFSQLVRSVGLGEFDSSLDGVVAHCRAVKALTPDAFIGLFTMLSDNRKAIKKAALNIGHRFYERDDIELGYLSLLLFPNTSDIDIDLLFRMQGKHTMPNIAKLVSAGISTEHIEGIMDNDLDPEITSRLMEAL